MRWKFCHFGAHWAAIRVLVNYLVLPWSATFCSCCYLAEFRNSVRHTIYLFLLVLATFALVHHLSSHELGLASLILLLLEWRNSIFLSIRCSDSVGSCNWPFVIIRCQEQGQGHVAFTHRHSLLHGALGNFECPLSLLESKREKERISWLNSI